MKQGIFQTNKIVHVPPDGTAATTYALGAGTTDVNSGAVDAIGFKRIGFLWIFGDNADTGTFAGSIEGSANGTDGWTAITGASDSFVAAASDTDNKTLGVECEVNPNYRYYRAVSNRGTANTVITDLLAILAEPAAIPITQSTSAGQFINTPTVV